jgi:Xaa-Pro aminopeptidase
LTEFEQRRRTLAAALDGAKVDVQVVSSPASIRYLTDFSGSNSLFLIAPQEAHFLTDPRYGLEAAHKVTCTIHVTRRKLIDEAATLIRRKKWKRVGFEPAWMTAGQHHQLQESLRLGASLKPAGGLVEAQRLVKSPAEIARIRRSVNLNSEAYSRTLRRIRAGVREQEVAAELDFQMRVLGAEKTAFDTIVAAGPHSALPHARPGDHRLANGELVLLDLGAIREGYASDMTRVVHLGSPPRHIRQMYRAVLDAQLAAIREVRAGVAVAKVDAAARNVLKQHKLDQAFVHSTGHGLGLEVHEAPRLAQKEKGKLKAGMVITIEPGAYLEGVCGIRVEDTVLVTENGCQIMTPTSKELLQL